MFNGVRLREFKERCPSARAGAARRCAGPGRWGIPQPDGAAALSDVRLMWPNNRRRQQKRSFRAHVERIATPTVSEPKIRGDVCAHVRRIHKIWYVKAPAF